MDEQTKMLMMQVIRILEKQSSLLEKMLSYQLMNQPTMPDQPCPNWMNPTPEEPKIPY